MQQHDIQRLLVRIRNVPICTAALALVTALEAEYIRGHGDGFSEGQASLEQLENVISASVLPPSAS